MVRTKPLCFPFLLPPSFKQGYSSYSRCHLDILSDTMPIYTSRLYQGCAASSCRTPVRSNFFTFLSLPKLSPTNGLNCGSLLLSGLPGFRLFFHFLSFRWCKGGSKYSSNALFCISPLYSSQLPHQKKFLKSF